MCDYENRNIQYYELCFSNGDADTETWICIKGVRQPTISEANVFCAKDAEMYNAKVVSVDPIDKTTARGCYDFDNEANWPVFG